MNDLPHRYVDMTPRLKESMARRLYRRSVARGEITLPAVPGMVDEYVKMCDHPVCGCRQKIHCRTTRSGQDGARGTAGRGFCEISTVDHRHLLRRAHRHGAELSRQSPMVDGRGRLRELDQHPRAATVRHRTRCPCVGVGDRSSRSRWYRVLDIGAGTGRNALALARRGHPVDVVEMTPKFAEMIRGDAERESLDVRVIQRDVFATMDDLRRDYQLILLSEVVSDFRTTQQLRAYSNSPASAWPPAAVWCSTPSWHAKATRPTRCCVELGQQMYTSIFTRQEMSAAASGLPLQLVADDSVYEYERAHLPEGAWPPTSWYAEWVSGRDVFDLPREECPIEMRWLVFQKLPERRMVTLQVDGTAG